MKIQPYVEKLHSSEEYRRFSEEHPDSFLTAGFFVIDFETGKNLHQIDYYVPSQKKIAAFTLDDEVKVQFLETLGDMSPNELDISTNTDLDALSGILEDEMKNRNISESIKKIIAVIQNLEGKKTWILNCILSGMEILKAHVDDESQTVLKMEKVSMMDIVKTIPASALQQKKNAPSEETKEDMEEELKQLDRIEKEIEKEKERLKKDMEEKDRK